MPIRRGCVILERDEAWHITATDSADPPCADVLVDSAEELADAVAAFVETHRLRRDRLLISPHANSVVFATFPAKELSASGDRQTMLFRLEDSLPFDAEQVVADFQADRETVSGVAVRSDRLLPLVRALEKRGLQVQSIVPVSILACQSLRRRPARAAEELILWQDANRCDWLHLSNGQLRQWRYLPADASALSRELHVQHLDSVALPAVTLVDVADELAEALPVDHHPVQRITTDGLSESARQFAGGVLSGSQTPWFELRRGRLANNDPFRAYRKSVTWLASAALALLIALAVSWWGRAIHIQRHVAEIKLQQRKLFQNTFPNAPVPRAIVSRIHSEHAKMIGSRQLTADVPRSHSALSVLHGFLKGRPTNLRSRMTEIRIENGVLTADVELRSHDDAGALAAALKSSEFSVEPPTTTQREDLTVVTRLHAKWMPVSADSALPSDESGGL